MEKALDLSIKFTKVSGIFIILQAKAIIYHFNIFWAKYEGIHQWIFINWTKNCDIYMCAKVFFVVQFNNKKNLEYVINEGP